MPHPPQNTRLCTPPDRRRKTADPSPHQTRPRRLLQTRNRRRICRTSPLILGPTTCRTEKHPQKRCHRRLRQNHQNPRPHRLAANQQANPQTRFGRTAARSSRRSYPCLSTRKHRIPRLPNRRKLRPTLYRTNFLGGRVRTRILPNRRTGRRNHGRPPHPVFKCRQRLYRQLQSLRHHHDRILHQPPGTRNARIRSPQKSTGIGFDRNSI